MAIPSVRVMLISQGRNFLVFAVETVIIYFWSLDIKRSPSTKRSGEVECG
jgi:hypothetical protein